MRSWNELSMAEKADIMKLAIEGGVYDLDSIRSGYNEYANGGSIHIKPENRGKFTALKERTGHSATWFKEHGTPAQKKMATFALNARKWKHGDGGNLFQTGGKKGRTENASDYRYIQTEDGQWNRVSNDNVGRVFQGLTVTPSKTKTRFVPEKIDNSEQGIRQREKFYQYRDEDGNLIGEQGLEIVSPEFDLLSLGPIFSAIGEAGLAAPTLVGDMEAVYQATRHPVQTARAIKKVAQEGARAIRNRVNFNSRVPIATKSVEEESFIPDFFLKDTKPMTKESVLQDLKNAKAYKESEGYRSLVEDFLKETGEPDIPADVFYSSRHTNVPDIVLEKRPSGHFGGYNHSENKISIDPSQAANDVPFHESLHWQRVGKPEVEKGPDYAAWGKSFDENASKDVQDALFNKYYNSEIGKRAMRQEDAIEALYKKKIDNVVYPDVPRTSEMRKPEELIAHTFGIGKSLGLQPFQEYPGLSRALNIIEKARKKDSWLWDIKAGGEEQVKDFWKLLTGNYMPATVGGATITGLTVPKR